METTVQIGKNGLNEEQINEIQKQLNKKTAVRIKILKSTLAEKDRNELFEEIKNSTGARTIKKAGNTIIIKKNI